MANNWHRIAAQMENNARNLVRAYQGYWIDAATQLAPIEDGDLRNSGTMTIGISDAFSAGIAFTAAHARPQEYGTMYMPAQSYLRPARDALRGALKRDARKLFGQ